MTRCDPGDVVLVRFPFTNLRPSKKRPAVVVSRPGLIAHNRDVIVMALTSVGEGEGARALQDWKDAGLVKPTFVKPLLATIEAGIVEKRLGGLSPRDRREVAISLQSVIAGEFLHTIASSR